MTESQGVGIDGASVLLGTLLGAGIGAVLGWYVARRQMEKEIAKEVAGIKEYFARKTRAEAASEGGDAGERAEATMADPGGVRTTGRVITKISDPRIELVLHPRHSALEGLEEVGPGDDEDHEDEGEDDDSPAEPLVRDTTKPYVISYEEFRDENDTYSKITLTYFTLDDTLCDERDAPIRDTTIVGVGFQEHFGEVGMDQPDAIYIRNDKLQVDFEIARREESYTESVLGYGKPK